MCLYCDWLQVEQKEADSEAAQGQSEAEEGSLPAQTAARGCLRLRQIELCIIMASMEK